MAIRSKVIRIGNSQGIRIPHILLQQAGLGGEVELVVEGNKLIIQSAQSSRDGWNEKFSVMAKQGDDHLLEETVPTHWDEEEWSW